MDGGLALADNAMTIEVNTGLIEASFRVEGV